ncbi:acyl-CoA mutase large subunit family protein [Pyrinomonas methylaliphatogenes]|jgi:methylmalonyl-CoA mutase N-terminal domain/subunit|uniref:Methylmalonyl-CoA mutase n=1 Tax=Pyrinomonas methylaliphatogenes TaxID=454194 RepID=A0A0B6X1N5_9BACT|nr:methylmalonyl-CoA mutase family protein [Pyrinomonas methylaliphatogenes]MBX5478067.1 methylmalonyl-CoA mutase family protein [Pyrinomonas methylaliphatogenes]CDM66912.1 methylmalonyl-CoA mutase [Pyrinomonas methylaliphatogenes]
MTGETKTSEKGERRQRFETSSGIELPNDFNPQNTDAIDYDRDLGAPGEFPFTRGIRRNMYRGRFWTMRQYAGYATAEESNARYKYLLSQGTTGLSVAFDLPTQIGLDSDDPLAAGEVGKVGVAIDSLEDMERLFDGIPLDQVSTSMTINATAAILLCLYIAVAKKQGVEPAKLRGTIQNDILKEYIARGTYIYPPAPSLRLITDTFAFCAREVPQWNMISISGYHIREAGATAVQEVAFTLANAITYTEAALKAGLEIDEFAPRLSFFFNAHNNLLEEVAKFRAARRMWARTMRDRFGARDPRSMMLRFHAQTAGSTLTAQQPEVNIVRTTIQALAAVLGGTQSLHTNAMDEALALPTEDSARLALRTQQVIAYESGVADTVDPLAGSYAIEQLTNEIERRAMDYIEKIEAMGGMLRAIETGYVQREIQEAAYRYQRAVETGDQIVVGVNRFRIEEEKPIPILRIDPEIERRQIERVRAVRARRDQVRVEAALAALEEAARGTENLLPRILDCVEAYATVGEISNRLRRVWGEYREAVDI